MLSVLSRKFVISKKQFLFQFQMVILTLFRMASPRLIPEKADREGWFFALATYYNVFLLYYYWISLIKGRKKAGIPDQTVDPWSGGPSSKDKSQEIYTKKPK